MWLCSSHCLAFAAQTMLLGDHLAWGVFALYQ